MSTPSPTLETEVLDIVKKHYRSFFMNRVHMYYRYIAVHNLLLISKSLGVPRTHLINLERLSTELWLNTLLFVIHDKALQLNSLLT